MTDPVSIVVGGLPIAGLAIQSAKSLYELVEAYKDCPELIKDLSKDISSLNAVLEEVQNAKVSSSATLDKLLRECSETSKMLMDVILDCTKHSQETKLSIIDRTMFLLKERRIKTLKGLLSSQKSMITIWLVLSIATQVKGISADDLPKIKTFIAKTAVDLDKVSHDLQQSSAILDKEEKEASPQDLAQRRDIQDLMEGTKRCLSILHELNAAIEHFRSMAPHPSDGNPTDSYARREYISAARTVSESLENCSRTCNGAIPSVQRTARNIQEDLRPSSSGQNLHDWIGDTVTFYRNFCKESSDVLDRMPINTFEGVNAESGAFQLIMAKADGSVSAKNVTAGKNAEQCLGMTNEAYMEQSKRRSMKFLRLRKR